MQEKLIIKNFGGIKDAEIEINEFNIFIGPQASGKSIVAKLLYYFKKLPFEISTTLNKTIKNKKDLGNFLVDEFTKYFPNHSYPKGNFSIRYETKYKFYLIEGNYTKVDIDFSLTYFSYLAEIQNEIRTKRESNPLEKIDINYFQSQYIDKITSSFIEKNNQIFIPSGRSFYAHIKKDIFTFLTNKLTIDPLLLEFGREYNIINDILLKEDYGEYKRNNLFVNVVEKVLRGNYISENDKEYLLHFDNRKVEIQYTSSGQQELLPLLRVLDFLLPRYSPDRTEAGCLAGNTSIYIEEPEAHIFPTAQKQIMELIVLAKKGSFHSNITNRQFIITTHSPYILTSLNNMMYAGYLDSKTKDENKKAELYNKIPKELIINPKLVNAFSMEDGKVKSIIDKENHLIASDIIDKVSDNIAIEFDGLLDVEFDK
ncbi:MAG: ATP-binding protein [Bacteroidales bacterium]|nr:ATP-binding protein [Bacteroidales bacterium]